MTQDGIYDPKNNKELKMHIDKADALSELKQVLTYSETQMFFDITDKMRAIYAEKNEAYGNSFSKLYKEYGYLAGIIPLSNKLNRIKSLVDSGKHPTESMQDSLLDLCCYSVMFLMELQREPDINC